MVVGGTIKNFLVPRLYRYSAIYRNNVPYLAFILLLIIMSTAITLYYIPFEYSLQKKREQLCCPLPMNSYLSSLLCPCPLLACG